MVENWTNGDIRSESTDSGITAFQSCLTTREALDFFRGQREQIRLASAALQSFGSPQTNFDLHQVASASPPANFDAENAIAGQCGPTGCRPVPVAFPVPLRTDFMPAPLRREFTPPPLRHEIVPTIQRRDAAPVVPPGDVVPLTPPRDAVETATPPRAVDQAVITARNEFIDVMARHYPNADRRQLEAMALRFEQRMLRLGEARCALDGNNPEGVYSNLNTVMVNFYRNLGRLASTPNGEGQLYNQQHRARLAENLLYYAANTTDQDQGPSNGSCWNISGRVLGMISQPDRMADFVTQLALTSRYQSPYMTRPFVLSHAQRQSLQIRPGSQESLWNIGNAATTNYRSPAGLLFDRGISFMLGRAHEHGGTYDEIRRAMQMITGRNVPFDRNLSQDDQRRALYEWGGLIEFVPGGRGRGNHMRTRQLVHRDGQWYVRRDDQHGAQGDYDLHRIPGLAAWLRQRTQNPDTMPPCVERRDRTGPFQPTPLVCPDAGPCTPQRFNPIRITDPQLNLDEYEIPDNVRRIIIGLLTLLIRRCFPRRASR